jgi:hypothetical protein
MKEDSVDTKACQDQFVSLNMFNMCRQGCKFIVYFDGMKITRGEGGG